MPHAQQLDPRDAVFLALEAPGSPAHIGGLAVLDPTTAPEGFDFEHFVEAVGERLPLCPRFTWQLQEVPLGLDHPYWVDPATTGNGAGLELERHIRRVAVPAPGGRRELSDLTSYLFAQPLDRSRPLWEMFLLEGLEGGRVALLWKVHHCLIDGMSGAGLVEQLFDIEPAPAPA